MRQMQLLPIRIADEQPINKNNPSTDLKIIGYDERGRQYALKISTPDNQWLPLIEWIAYHLCRACGIATPEFTQVIRFDGSIAFGSRWVDDCYQFSAANTSLEELIQWLHQCKSEYSAILALDAYIPNHDRHMGNLLFKMTGKRMQALAFDWSRTELLNPWPWKGCSNSAKALRWAKTENLIEMTAIKKTLHDIQVIHPHYFKDIIDSAHESWKVGCDTTALVTWWKDNATQRSIDALKLVLNT